MASRSAHNIFADDLLANLPNLRSSGVFSDFTITCDDSIFNVHKLILGSHSGYFATMFASGFKEAQENSVVLEEDKSYIVDAMIEALYDGDYIYENDDDLMESEDMFHAKVYAIADKYDVPKLKILASEHFVRSFATAESTVRDIAETIEYVYDSTPESDRCLRDIVVHIAADRTSDFYRCPEFEAMAGTVSDFCNDLAKRLGVKQELSEGWKKPLLPITCWDITASGPYPNPPQVEMVNGRQHIQEDLLPAPEMYQFGSGIPGMPMPSQAQVSDPSLPPGWQVKHHLNGARYYLHPPTGRYSECHPSLM
ncbi:hypothetical protein BLS_003780 [Venturia inaequalis]|uniref:BTB domain-containing protein n=1 Tax=Venturia inaequalis TaxID=5025 RepID=A0A8H3YV35_VENIN|nr:hypothetical protein BLS_003780 [Venturia inaequalis]